MSADRKLSEPVRAHLAIVRGVLDPLDKDTRHAVFEELNLILAKELTAQDAEMEQLRMEIAEWKWHNENRFQEVHEARELMGATPAETLTMALKRYVQASK